MKKFVVIPAAIMLAASSAIAGANFNMDIASAYVFRGITVVDDLVVQPNVELSGFGLGEEYGSIAFGVWGSAAPFEDTYDNLHETDWYLVYTLPQLVTNLNLSIGLTEYQYVASPGEKEINLAVSYNLFTNIVMGGSVNMMTDNENAATEDQIYIDFFTDYTIALSEDTDASLGALLSFMKQGDGNDVAGLDNGFNHFELKAGISHALTEMWYIGGSLAYIGQLDDNVLPDNTATGNYKNGYDRSFVAMFTIGCDM